MVISLFQKRKGLDEKLVNKFLDGFYKVCTINNDKTDCKSGRDYYRQILNTVNKILLGEYNGNPVEEARTIAETSSIVFGCWRPKRSHRISRKC